MAVVCAEGLTFRYPGAVVDAVHAVHFAIEPGEIFGFLGPSGAGKSTTQKVLIRLLRGYSGTVAVLGRDLQAWGREYYERIGVSFELPNHHLKLTARENLDCFAALYPGAVDDPRRVLDAVGLGDDADRRVGSFSKGMRVRLNLARALLHRPELLFLDEPTSGLDPVTKRQIRDLLLERRAAGATIVISTHDMALADEFCDRVAFLVDARIRLIDSPRALRLRHGRQVVRVEVMREGALVRCEFPLAGIGHDPAFLATIREGAVETIHTQETTLEEIFIAVTGRPIVTAQNAPVHGEP